MLINITNITKLEMVISNNMAQGTKIDKVHCHFVINDNEYSCGYYDKTKEYCILFKKFTDNHERAQVCLDLIQILGRKKRNNVKFGEKV